jgi:putative ubiquitin-RnfH superfamily antitoxin RatB of RatAB toxin-antitoxin module
MNNVSEAEQALYKSLISTKDDVIEIWKNQIEIFSRLNKIEEKIRKLEKKNG